MVTTYLLPLVNLDLRPRLLEQMRPGARLVTHAFHMGDDWWPDATDNVRGRVLFSWAIPAKVGGRWQVESEDGNFALDIDQTFQSFKATAHVERRTLPKVVEAHTTRSATAASTAPRSASPSTSASARASSAAASRRHHRRHRTAGLEGGDATSRR